MSEGGLYPWRRQKPDGVVYCDYAEVLKPLPPPPDGLCWVKRRIEATAAAVEVVEGRGPEEGDEEGGDASVVGAAAARFVWELVEKPARPSTGEEEEEPPLVELENDDLPDFIEHTVLATDTMAGLRLRYKITPAELRKHNDFAGENFHMLPTLRIPIEGREDHIKKHKQRPTRDVLRQRFANAARCTDHEMQTYYLESNDWDVAAAVRECEEDRKWEEEHRALQQMLRVPAAGAGAADNDANANANNAPVQQQQEPPPSYSSLFKIKRRPNNNNGGNRPSHYYPWPITAASSSSTSALLRRPSARGVTTYDMSDFAAAVEDAGGDYVRIGGNEAGPPVAVAMMAPAAAHHDNEEEGSHEAALRAPLLGRRVPVE